MKTASPELQGLLQAMVAHPQDEVTYLVLADWLEEHDDPGKAELLRLHRRLLATCCEPDYHPARASWQARIVELLGEGLRPCVPQRRVDLGGGVEMVFSFIPPGTFLMGSPSGQGDEDERPQHRVTLTKGFFLGVHPVTQVQWQSVMGSNPSNFKGDSRPVEEVSWEDCQEFCRKLGERDGQQYGLPTEAEWEYACRAGTTTDYCCGDGEEALKKAGWYGTNSEPQTHPVGQKQPNAWGLLDVHGNVWEWCLDGKRTYASGDIVDPLGPQGKEDARVLRGGSWLYFASYCRSAFRFHFAPSIRYYYVGCRVVLCLD